MMFTLQILICTTLSRLSAVQSVLLPPLTDVSYLVSCQGVSDSAAFVPPFSRPDVVFFTMPEFGLSRNRNAALLHSSADFLLLCDDDERLCKQTVLGIVTDFLSHPEWDIIQYQFSGGGKRYPSTYVSSVELALSRVVARSVRFDERFGLGSPYLACGEEEVFVADARRRGFTFGYLPRVVCTVANAGTGSAFLANPRVQRSKGAVFCLTRGAVYAYCKCFREALGWMLRRGVNPIPLLCNMFWGIRYVRS